MGIRLKLINSHTLSKRSREPKNFLNVRVFSFQTVQLFTIFGAITVSAGVKILSYMASTLLGRSWCQLFPEDIMCTNVPVFTPPILKNYQSYSNSYNSHSLWISFFLANVEKTIKKSVYLPYWIEKFEEFDPFQCAFDDHCAFSK